LILIVGLAAPLLALPASGMAADDGRGVGLSRSSRSMSLSEDDSYLDFLQDLLEHELVAASWPDPSTDRQQNLFDAFKDQLVKDMGEVKDKNKQGEEFVNLLKAFKSFSTASGPKAGGRRLKAAIGGVRSLVKAIGSARVAGGVVVFLVGAMELLIDDYLGDPSVMAVMKQQGDRIVARIDLQALRAHFVACEAAAMMIHGPMQRAARAWLSSGEVKVACQNNEAPFKSYYSLLSHLTTKLGGTSGLDLNNLARDLFNSATSSGGMSTVEAVVFTRNALMSIADQLSRLSVLVVQTQGAYDAAMGTKYCADISARCLPMLDSFAGVLRSAVESFTDSKRKSLAAGPSIVAAAERGDVSLVAEQFHLAYPGGMDPLPKATNAIVPPQHEGLRFISALGKAAEAGHSEVVAIFMRYMHRQDTSGKACLRGTLHAAALKGRVDGVRALLRGGMPIALSGEELAQLPRSCRAAIESYPKGTADLLAAVASGRPEEVRAVLARGVQSGSLESPDQGGRCAVVLAAEKGCLPVLRVLLETQDEQAGGGGRASACDRDRRGVTPLMAAAAGGHLEVVKALLDEYGAVPSVNFRDWVRRQTAVDVAGGRPETVARLERAGGRPANDAGCSVM